MKKKAGIFYATAQLVWDNTDAFCEAMSKLKFIATKVEYQPFNDRYEYTGYSPQFEELEEGCCIPLYNITIRTEDGEIVAATATRSESMQLQPAMGIKDHALHI